MLHLLSFLCIKSIEVLSFFDKLQTRTRAYFGSFLVFGQLFEVTLIVLQQVFFAAVRRHEDQQQEVQ